MAPSPMKGIFKHGLCWTVPVLLVSCASPRQGSAFEKADVNDDDRITLQELSDVVTLSVFEEGDEDRDGYLSFAEWRKLAPELDPAVFKTRDLNGDGRIDRKEALAFTRENKTFYPAFEGLDDDGDSVIDVEEAREFLREQSLRQPEGRS
jgi:Ca2+-binding EF-hand superfamily protein